MTFDSIVQQTLDRLNLTSDDARIRVGRRVNERYRRMTSSIGLVTSRRKVETFSLNPIVLTDLPDYTVTDMEKVLKVTLLVDSERIRVLKQLTYDELTNIESVTALPRAWAVKSMGANTVTITFDSTPSTTINVSIEGYDLTDDMTNDQEPFFPQDFHDILVDGAAADELMKMEKPQLATMFEQRYESRLSDLRMFAAKSAYLDIIQGKDKPNQLWYRPWYSRTSSWN